MSDDRDTDNRESDTVQIERPGVVTTDGALDVGTKIGDYIIDGIVGIGGCGAVYTARHREEDRVAAVKVLHHHMASSPKMVARFMRELEAVDVIDHPNIVDIYDLGELSDGRPYQIMELVPGLTLASAIETRGRFSPELTLDILEPLCSALQEAHDAGVLHRDLKLSNIMVDFDAEPMGVTLLDFGVAKLMDGDESSSDDSTGMMMGTPQVMAPEQINGDSLDARADQYSLGVLVFSMLTGRPPFNTRDINALLQQHLSAVPPLASKFAPVGSAIDAVIACALEKSPRARYKSVEAFFEAFRDAVLQAPQARVRTTTQVFAPLIQEDIELPDPRATGIYISATLLEVEDTFDDELLDDLSLCLDEAEVMLRDAGFQILLATGTALLGVKVLPESGDEEQAARRRTISLANQLQSSLNVESIDRASLGVHAHVDYVTVRGAGLAGEVTGGPLTKTDSWIVLGAGRKAQLTHALVDGLLDTGSDGDR